MKNKKILIIGAVPHPDDLKTYGGTTTLMQNFIDYCNEHRYSYQHIDTLKYKNKWKNMFYFVFAFLCGVLTCKVVMFNLSRNGVFTLFYNVAPICYALRRKVVFRKFGGNFLGQLEACPQSKRLRLVRLLNRASVIYFETKYLIQESPNLFRFPQRIMWFPNCRKPCEEREIHSFRKRFVFVSRVEECKGVDRLLTVADRLPDDYVVHIYGPIVEEKYLRADYFSGHKAKYLGALKTEGVLSTLKEYDVLVLPTSWQTEGYPGIITEAMSVGLPVISTRIGGIPEMITEEENGILVPPTDVDSLYNAIVSINEDNYRTMSDNAFKQFDDNYNSDTINEKVYRTMINL